MRVLKKCFADLKERKIVCTNHALFLQIELPLYVKTARTLIFDWIICSGLRRDVLMHWILAPTEQTPAATDESPTPFCSQCACVRGQSWVASRSAAAHINTCPIMCALSVKSWGQCYDTVRCRHLFQRNVYKSLLEVVPCLLKTTHCNIYQSCWGNRDITKAHLGPQPSRLL